MAAGTREDPIRTWEAAEARNREFQGLLRKYRGDWQKATDALSRGEKPDPEDDVGSPYPR